MSAIQLVIGGDPLQQLKHALTKWPSLAGLGQSHVCVTITQSLRNPEMAECSRRANFEVIRKKKKIEYVTHQLNQ